MSAAFASTPAFASFARVSLRNSPALGQRFTFTQYRQLGNMASIKKNCKKIVCIGRNYADHIAELSSARPKQPFFFLKPTTCIHLPSDGPMIRPKGVNLHYEIELGLVIGKTVRDLSADDTHGAMSAVSAYFLSIDMTARNIQNEAKQKGLPWDISKGFDTFLPISEVIPKDRIKDPHNITIELKVNGETHQRDSTNLMLFQIPRMLSDISKVMTLEEGDIVITGTPKGVGPVVPGDVMTGRLEDEEGKEIIKMEVGVKESEGAYVFSET